MGRVDPLVDGFLKLAISDPVASKISWAKASFSSSGQRERANGETRTVIINFGGLPKPEKAL
jgi:hypothetical protein